MIKEIVLTALIGGAGGAAIYLGDTRYVMQSSYEQSVQQRRAWELQDKIDEVNGRVQYEGRKTTPYEKQQILNWEQQIRRLQGG